MVPDPVVSSRGRLHIVLVPGFAGFDALGQIEYYAGTTESYRRWLVAGGASGRSVVLHYFDNLPTAGVSTRAARLRTYLAKRIARGEIQEADTIAMVGHSTGGLDIRRLLFAGEQALPELQLDGGEATATARATAIPVEQAAILDKVTRVVFVSVPQYGTNIADWVRGYPLLRRVVIEDMLRAVDGARIPPIEVVLSGLLGDLARLAQKPDLVLAARDALDETRAARDNAILRANAEEAASQLRLWLQHAVDDFGAIEDLAAFTDPPHNSTSPAHYSENVRRQERQLWAAHGIETMSIATVARRAFRFDPGERVDRFDLLDAGTWPTNELVDGAGQMDVSYLFAYRACAGGPFDYPPFASATNGSLAQLDTTMLDPTHLGLPRQWADTGRLEIWDNDAIVNTASMLWPNEKETRLVAADHLDIVGHFTLRKTTPSPSPSGRRYASYDALGSHSEFMQVDFDRVWQAIFDFCAS
jgi:triacylglycerol lipase